MATGGRAGIEMRDGWALDHSGSLPHLDRLLEEMGRVIEERGLRPWEEHGKPFLKDILPERSWERYASILDFACSLDVLAPMAPSSRCLHFGSRNPASPRYHMQYAYVSPVRDDFSDLLRPQARYPSAASDPLSRRLALDRELLVG